MIAQEVEKLIDTNEFAAVKHSLVNSPGKYDDYALDYTEFIPVLIKAVQELTQKVEAQHLEIEKLKEANS
jgi:hypothetical protein